jgi:hypothetical protein
VADVRKATKEKKRRVRALPSHFSRCKLGRVSLNPGTFYDERSAAVASAK